jgi:hypothetical protein
MQLGKFHHHAVCSNIYAQILLVIGMNIVPEVHVRLENMRFGIQMLEHATFVQQENTLP